MRWMIAEYKSKTNVVKMKTNKIWKVGVSAIVGILIALWLVVPSASARDIKIQCRYQIRGGTTRNILCVKNYVKYISTGKVKEIPGESEGNYVVAGWTFDSTNVFSPSLIEAKAYDMCDFSDIDCKEVK